MKLLNAIEKLRGDLGDMSDKDMFFGISGGVDSSVLAVLIKEAGLNVRGFHAVCWDEGGYCTAQDDLKDALGVAAKFGIEMNVLDLKKDYREFVFGPFLDSYRAGYVTNIDISCNEQIKFGLIFDRLVSETKEILVTGHYSSLGFIPAEFTKGKSIKTLKIPLDLNKDQTYFLSHIIRRPGILDRVFFPAALFSKSEIRELALELGLSNAKKPDSQGICFIGNVDMKSFLSEFIKKKEGKIVDIAGNIIGKHNGVAFYTIGQRHGFELTKYFSEPLYIVQKDPVNNLLVAGPREQAFSSSTNIKDYFSLLDKQTFDGLCKKKKIRVRFRNLGKLIPVKNLLEINDKKFLLEIEEPEFGLTPGQEAVFYFDDLVVGSGVIDY